MQRGMAERNVSVAADQQIVFRIGINVGDIIIDGADIFGDGVNVAARLQTLAEPGGICVSRNVRDQVLDKLGFAFEDLGTQEVKNIARAIEVYRIRDEMAIRDVGQPSRANAQQSSRWKRFRGLRWAIAAGVFVCSLGVAAWYFLIPSKSVAVATGAPAMSVAIMPFVPASAGDGDKQLADVLTLDLTTALQRSIRGALVVSHGLAARYQGASPDPRVVGRDLNVRYLIEGKVQTVDAGTSVSTRLVKTDDGIQLWSDPQATSRGPMSDRIEEIVAQISNRVRPALVAAEDKRIAG
jgi:TolB-like protein